MAEWTKKRRRAAARRMKEVWSDPDERMLRSAAMRGPRRRRPIGERFWEKVQKTHTCWIWIGAVASNGRGVLRTFGSTTTAARTSWELHNGPIPEEKLVLHACGSAACVRPDHLVLGTAQDRTTAMLRAFRWRPSRGEVHGISKLTDDQVREIRSAPRVRGSGKALAEKYAVACSTISMIRSGAVWKHLL